MGNTSATGGVIVADPPYPLDDDSLDLVLQQLVVGITALDINMVRPRWQQVVPIQPAPSVDWCAIGVVSATADAGPWIGYDPQNNVGPYTRHETLELVATFYGPNSKRNAAFLRDGLAIPQNTDVLRANDMAFVSCGSIRAAPAFVNEQWIKRQDIPVTLRRKVTRSYQIHYLAIADVRLIDDSGVNGSPVVDDTFVVPPGSTLEP